MPNSSGGRFIGYFDASGTANTDVLVMAGYVSDAKKWDRFDHHWKAILDRESVKCFHMTDCVSGQGEYKGWDSERRRQFINDLAECARKYTNKRFSASVVINDYNLVDNEYELHEYVGYPYVLCGISCIGHVRAWAKRHKLKAAPQFVFEDGDARRGNFSLACQQQFGVTPVFSPKKDVLRLQAADLAAWKTRHPIREAVSDRPYTQAQFERLLFHTRAYLREPHAGGGFDRDALMKICTKHPIPLRRANSSP